MNQLRGVVKRVRYNARYVPSEALISLAAAKIDYLSAYPRVEPAGKIAGETYIGGEI